MNWKELRATLIGDRKTLVLPPKVKLPMLPHAVLEFGRKADDPQSGPRELGRIIETDSGLTTKLCRYVNSSQFALRSKAATAQQALSMLGIRPAKLFLLSAGVNQAMKSCQSKLVNFQSFWLTNLERALFAKEVALLLKADADLAYAGSMLQDFLLPLLTNEEFPHYLKYAETPERERRPLVDYEKTTFGWDHALATAQVMLAWQFPDDLICCVLLHHSGLAVLSDPDVGRTAAAAVAVAGLVPDPLHQSGKGLSQLVKLMSVWPEFDLVSLADRVAGQLEEATPLARQHLTLKRRVDKQLATNAVTAGTGA